VKQCGDNASKQIIELRDRDGEYFSFSEFVTRNKFKGGKVTKQVIENLIFAGAFDGLENIKNVRDRRLLIEKYRDVAKCKIDEDKDLLSQNIQKLHYDWWWTLQQKIVSSIAFFDYADLLDTYIDDDSHKIDMSDFQSEDVVNSGRDVKIGGVISEIIERKTKKGEDYCKILLESNYIFVRITVWPEMYKKLRREGGFKEKNIMLVSGTVSYDSFAKENVLFVNENSSYIFLE